MKRVFTFLITTLIWFSGYSQINMSISTYVDGAWSSWKTFRNCYIYGNYGIISQYEYGHHPSEFIWRFTINNFNMPKKTKDWLEFSGTIEYYISDAFPDARSQFLHQAQQGFVVAPWNHDATKGQMPCVKKTSSATIRIAPYKKHPRVYNILFDGVGLAIDFQDGYVR